jgi:hypothetical protein
VSLFVQSSEVEVVQLRESAFGPLSRGRLVVESLGCPDEILD